MGPDHAELISVCVALAWLGGAILFARANRPTDAYQLRRVPRAAGTFIAGSALIPIVLAALSGQPGIVLFHIILVGAIIVGMLTFLSVLVVDVVAILLGATRTPPWLALAMVAAVCIAYFWLFTIGGALWGVVPNLQSPVSLSPGLLAAAAGLVWWSELPRHADDTDAAIFD